MTISAYKKLALSISALSMATLSACATTATTANDASQHTSGFKTAVGETVGDILHKYSADPSHKPGGGAHKKTILYVTFETGPAEEPAGDSTDASPAAPLHNVHCFTILNVVIVKENGEKELVEGESLDDILDKDDPYRILHCIPT